MAGEEARVKVHVSGEDDFFWVENTVNGYASNIPIRAASIEDAERMAPQIEHLIKTLYRKAYRDGFFSCQQAIKDVLGISK